MLQEYQKRNEQILQEKAKSYEEFLKQAMVKMEKDRAELMAEHQRMLTFKLLVFNQSQFSLLMPQIKIQL